MYQKAIIQGRLEFGTPRAYEQVITQFEYRDEAHFKGLLMFHSEDIFVPEEYALNIPRHVGQVFEKSFRNTMTLLEYCAQFALTGTIYMWLIDEGEVKHYAKIEPDSDKTAVQYYLKGKDLVKVTGKEEEAIASLSKAISKYDRHGQAYERRAKVNYTLKKYADALRDYNKSIGIDNTNPHAFYGRAKVHMINENYQAAIDDFENTLKYSFALQPLYWKARRIKSKCHLQLKQWKDMAFDLKHFTEKAHEEGSTNGFWLRWAFVHYAIALTELNQLEEAIQALNKAEAMPNLADGISEAEILRLRGIARKKANKNGAIKDLKRAAELGDKIATSWLQQKNS